MFKGKACFRLREFPGKFESMNLRLEIMREWP